MIKILEKYYGIKNPDIKKLDGYDISNYKIAFDSKNYVAKVYPDEREEINFVDAENKALEFLATDDGFFPVPAENTENKLLTYFEEKGQKKVLRLLTYLEGESLGNVKHTKELFYNFGEFLGKMNLKLLNFQNYTIKARQFKWDLQHFNLNKKLIKYIKDPSDRKIAEYIFLQYNEHVYPLLPELRKSIIHSDANEWNTLVQGDSISGLIDFGDLCYSQLINELGIAIAYAVMGKENPIEWALPIVRGYHKILPLEKIEIEILFYLIAARLVVSICNSSYTQTLQPENKYISVSQKPALELLRKWITINPIHVKNTFIKATGFEINPVKETSEVISRRCKNISPIFSLSYKKPIYMDGAAFQYMFDKYGNSYLDAYNNIPHVGHSHPKIVEAGQKQMAKLNTNTRYLYDSINEYSDRLIAKFPDPLNKVFFVNSGSAATDLAIRLARNFTGFETIAVLEHGYHGNTQLGIDISHYKFSGKGGKGISENVICLPLPDTYRGKFRTNNGGAGISYAHEAINQINNATRRTAAFIAEPIIGCGGQIPLVKNYLKELYSAVRRQGGVCISDEVQTGFGRMGDVFWGFEQHSVIPEIVILGKPMGNGHPIGAVVTTDEIAENFNNGMEFFSSFGGNPVSCAIGLAVLDVIEEEQLQQNAKEVGYYYLHELKRLQQKVEYIGDVRGSGLFIGFEFVKDRLTLEPDTILANHVKNELRNHFILTSTDGPFDNVVKSKPPLCFSKENVDEVISGLIKILNS